MYVAVVRALLKYGDKLLRTLLLDIAKLDLVASDYTCKRPMRRIPSAYVAGGVLP
jgi:hypothetical protein